MTLFSTNYINKTNCIERFNLFFSIIQFSLFDVKFSQIKKKRVMINIKNLNDIIENDSYFFSLQFDIIVEIVDSFYIFVIDVVD